MRHCRPERPQLPLAALGGKETGGMNVYVRELSRQMGRLGIGVDVFTRSQNPHFPHRSPGPKCPGHSHQGRTRRAGGETQAPPYMSEFTSAWCASHRRAGGLRPRPFPLLVSGWVGGRLKKLWSIPLVHMFHTLGVLKNTAGQGRGEGTPEGSGWKGKSGACRLYRSPESLGKETNDSSEWDPPAKVK